MGKLYNQLRHALAAFIIFSMLAAAAVEAARPGLAGGLALFGLASLWAARRLMLMIVRRRG